MESSSVEAALLEAKPEGDIVVGWKQTLAKKTWAETKIVSRISLPSVVSRVTSFGVLIITQAMIGHISAVDLAAYALVQSISLRFINGIVLGMSSATETLCGQAYGAKQYHMLGIYLQRSWIVNFVTVTIMTPLLIFSTPIYELLGEADDIADATETISLWLIPIQYTYVFTLTIQMYLQSQMRNIFIAYICTVFLLVHIVVSWLFVYKLNLGASGAMAALVISQWGVVFGEFVYIFGGWCKETWSGFSLLALADLLPVIKLSVSSGFMLCLELWYTSVLVLIAGYSNDAAVEISAFSICLNLNSWEFMIALSLLAGACVRVSNEIGRGNIEAAKFAIVVLLWMAAALGLFSCVMIIIFGNSYPYLFTSDDTVAEAAADLSLLLALTMLVSSFQAVFSGVAIGIGSQAKVAVVNVVSYYIIGIPVGCLLGFVAGLGIKGIWIGMLIGMVIQVIALIVLTLRIDWEEEVNKSTRRLKQFHHDAPEVESNQSSSHE